MSRRSARTSTPGLFSGDRSRMSPTRISRIQEKEELQNLNDRLAVYIDTVRRLEVENSRLSVQIKTAQETVTREVSTIKNAYEKELGDVRRALDTTAKENAKLQITADKLKKQTDDVSSKLSKKEKEVSSLERQLKSSEEHNQDLQRRLNQNLSDNRKFEKLLKEVQGERDSLLQQLNAVKQELEHEILTRVDLHNRLQSMKEELNFKESVHQKEITETKQKKETEVNMLDSKLRESYEQKLTDTLRELREHYETQMRINRDDIETVYETKIVDMQNKLGKATESSTSYRDELRILKSKGESLNSKIVNLEIQSKSLQNRIRDLEKMLDQERIWHGEAVKQKDDEIIRLRNETAKNLAEFQDLLDIKIALDLEIAAYRKLLEAEELRLSMSPVGSPASSPQITSTPIRSSKRKRTEMERTSQGTQVSARAKGDIEIAEQDVSGKFIKIFNKGTSDVAIGSWQLVQKAGTQEVKFKFPKAASIKANSHISVWSADSGIANNPPENYLMKNHSWCSSGTLSTVLLNSNNEEIAINKSVRLTESSELQLIEEC